MKLFLYALMTSLFLFAGCESYHSQDESSAIQKQEERKENQIDTSEAVEIKPFPERGGNAGNK